MSAGRDEGPIYYREIQKNAYLKRIPNEIGGSKLRPLGHKKPPLKPMWTQFCVHNGRTPFLEQYPEAECAATHAHKPSWRACLRTARHVTASVKPRVGDEYDFLVDTDHGPVRMLAPDWESMQDWVITLRSKLHELKILSKGENVYMAPPAAPAPRAAARDPTSPLPPTPPVPPDRVPGIELTTPIVRQTIPEPDMEPEPTPASPEPEDTQASSQAEDIDISHWDTPFSQPSTSTTSTSQETKVQVTGQETKKSVAKICGQNICLDDSILRRNTTDSDEEFFAEIDRIHGSVEDLECDGDSYTEGYKQRVVVNDVEKAGSSVAAEDVASEHQGNITVIQVSNRAPHTAIPVIVSNTDVFDFNFKQKLSINPEHTPDNPASFVNIVNTERSSENRYGTVFAKDNTEYGHLSLTTTVSLSGDMKTDNEGIYERLCMASTSNASPLLIRKLKVQDKVRKSSLPNLDVASSSEMTYEYLFPNCNNNGRTTTNITLNELPNGRSEINSNVSQEVSRTESRAEVPVNVHVNVTSSISVGGNVDPNARELRSNVERSHSQNAYDAAPGVRENLIRRVQNNSPKRENKNDKADQPHPKPIWKRGLTELSLLSRLRGIGQRLQDSPTRQDDRTVTSPAKVVHRSRQETRVDGTRRRSSSLSNGQSPGGARGAQPLQPLRARQAAALRVEQRRGAAVPAAVPVRDPPVFADYNRQVWVAWWAVGGARCGGRAGDRVAALRGAAVRDAAHARQLLRAAPAHLVDILFHRVPLGKIYVLNKRDLESIGIKLDGECNISVVESQSPAARAGIPPPGKWAVTEVNNRPINLIKGGEDEMNRLSLHGTEVSVLIQPSALVKKIRAAIKGNKHLLLIR